MLTFWGVITAVTTFGGLPIVAALWTFERRRSGRRNRRGACASCGAAWSSTLSSEPYLIHGRLVCESCASKARRRLPWHFGILGLAVATTAVGIALVEGGLPTMILLPIGATGGMAIGAVQLMKLANRTAQRRIAAGEYPDIEAVRGRGRLVGGSRA